MEETGEYGEQELNHSDGEAERFSRELKGRGVSVRVGMEATGHARWFERLLAELGFQLWIVDPADWNSDGDFCALIRLPSLLTTPIPVVWHNHDTALRFRLPTTSYICLDTSFGASRMAPAPIAPDAVPIPVSQECHAYCGDVLDGRFCKSSEGRLPVHICMARAISSSVKKIADAYRFVSIDYLVRSR